MIETLHGADNPSALEEYMSSDEIVLRKVIGVSETEIDVSVGSKMKDSINVESAKAREYVGISRYVTVNEGKVRPALQHS